MSDEELELEEELEQVALDIMAEENDPENMSDWRPELS